MDSRDIKNLIVTHCIDNYRDLSLRKYEQIIQANKIESDIDRQVAVIAILTDLSEREVLNLPISEYTELATKTTFLTKEMARIPRPAHRYKVGNFTLIPTTDLRKVTTAQYIDFQNYAPGADEKLVEILSCFLIPEGYKYNDGYDVIEVQDAIRDLSVQDAVSLSAFFLHKYAALIRGTRISLEKMLKRERNPETRAKIREKLDGLGDGYRALMQ